MLERTVAVDPELTLTMFEVQFSSIIHPFFLTSERNQTKKEYACHLNYIRELFQSWFREVWVTTVRQYFQDNKKGRMAFKRNPFVWILPRITKRYLNLLASVLLIFSSLSKLAFLLLLHIKIQLLYGGHVCCLLLLGVRSKLSYSCLCHEICHSPPLHIIWILYVKLLFA